MQVTEITAGISYTHNLGNYESLRLEVRSTASLVEGEDPDQSYRTLFADCERQVLEQFNSYMSRAGRGGVHITPTGK